MRAAHSLDLLRLACLTALTASAALYVDYATLNPAFCTAADSGCGAVRHSGFGYLPLGGVGVPVPALGLVGFASLFAASLFGALALRRRLVLALGVVGGAAGVGLFLLQALVIGRFCEICLVADGAAVVAASAAVLFHRASAREAAVEAPALARWAWLTLGALAIAAPLLWPRVRPRPPVPPGIAAYYQPGKINVVEFADFGCPFCRMLHPRLNKLVAAYPGKVNFVRLNLPLPQHPGARDAARAYLCAEAQQRGDQLADRLFEADELGPAANRRLAVELGLDADAFDRCVAAPATDATIDRQTQLLRAAGFQGLPTTYVGATQIIGAQPDEVFRKAFDEAERGESARGVPGAVYVLLALLAALGVAAAGRRKPAPASPTEPPPSS